MRFIGVPIKRLEDPRLLVGGGRYVDDLVRPGTVHAVLVRSAHAHARIRRIDVRHALAQPGVLACLTATDLAGVPMIPLRQPGKPGHAAYLQPPLAGEKVRYVGQPIAVVVATDRVTAVDASERVEIDYDPLPARIDLDDAGSPLFAEGDVADSWTTTIGDVDAALRSAACVVGDQFYIGRQTAAPMETRGLLAEWDGAAGKLRVSGASKVPFPNRRVLAKHLGLGIEQIEMLEGDTGGAFGVRGEFYPEDFLIPYAAKRVGRPVKWIEDRREHLIATNHARDADCELELACDGDGRILALRGHARTDVGAYLRTNGLTPSRNVAQVSPGPYRIPHVLLRVSAMLTN
ncbi:MAG TPA: molybdopterin cofactor-binding domain-containing protein, partial [Methylomirabilota bacterium]|nr:molybdopterin cofactor-binding domain-containing protein [Methylomirabilota bacterium]